MFPDGITLSLVLGSAGAPGGDTAAPRDAGTTGDMSLLSPLAWARGVSVFSLLFVNMPLSLWSICH